MLGACAAALGAAACRRAEVVEQAPTVVTDSTRLPRPAVRMGCLAGTPRTSFADVRWPPAGGVAPDSVWLDFTVFKSGFRAGQYATLGAAVTEPVARMFFRPEVPLAALRFERQSRRRAGDTTVMRVERLEPGVNYFWRLRAGVAGRWLAGIPTRAQAPVCGAEERR